MVAAVHEAPPGKALMFIASMATAFELPLLPRRSRSKSHPQLLIYDTHLYLSAAADIYLPLLIVFVAVPCISVFAYSTCGIDIEENL